MRITDMNAVMEAVRQSVIKKKGNDQEDLYLRTLELAQVQEDEYFGHVVSKDLTSILRDIRDTHRKDATTADESCAALEVQKQLQDAMDYKGSAEEKKARLFLANLGIDEEDVFVALDIVITDAATGAAAARGQPGRCRCLP